MNFTREALANTATVRGFCFDQCLHPSSIVQHYKLVGAALAMHHKSLAMPPRKNNPRCKFNEAEGRIVIKQKNDPKKAHQDQVRLCPNRCCDTDENGKLKCVCRGGPAQKRVSYYETKDVPPGQTLFSLIDKESGGIVCFQNCTKSDVFAVAQTVTLLEAADPDSVNQDFSVVASTLAPLLRPLCYFFDDDEDRDRLIKEAINKLETKKGTSEAKRAHTRIGHVEEEEMGNKVSKNDLEASVRKQLEECGVLPGGLEGSKKNLFGGVATPTSSSPSEAEVHEAQFLNLRRDQEMS